MREPVASASAMQRLGSKCNDMSWAEEWVRMNVIVLQCDNVKPCFHILFEFSAQLLHLHHPCENIYLCYTYCLGAVEPFWVLYGLCYQAVRYPKGGFPIYR